MGAGSEAGKPAAETDAPQHRPAPNIPQFTKDEDLHAYREMLLIRRFEEKAGQLYGMGLIGGFCHLYIGQEAVVVGMQMATKTGDQVITGYRDHGHMLACGMDPKGVMAELTGRRGGLSKGKGGSMHMFSVEKHFYGGHGIVGAQVSLGTGLAFANRYRGNDNVSLTYFGDGAANQGQVYESFNMAELWKLPVVYVIENNRYAMGTSVSRASAQTDFSKRGISFDIPGEQVDGMDVRAVYAAAQRAVQWCRDGKGPTSWRCRPTAIVVTPCPIRPSTAPRTRSSACARSTIRSSRCAAACWRTGSSARTTSRPSMRVSARSSTRPRNSPPTIPSPIRPSFGPTS